MNTGTRTALALAGGYLLGRRRKMRWLMLLAAAGATGRLGVVAGQVMKRGVKIIGPVPGLEKLTPALGDITGAMRGDLADAGKAAAVAALSSRVESLTDALRERAETLRNPQSAGEEEDSDREHEEGGPRRAGRGRGEVRERGEGLEHTEARESVEEHDGQRRGGRPGSMERHPQEEPRPARSGRPRADEERRPRRRAPEHPGHGGEPRHADESRHGGESGHGGRRRAESASAGRSPVRRTGR